MNYLENIRNIAGFSVLYSSRQKNVSGQIDNLLHGPRTTSITKCILVVPVSKHIGIGKKINNAACVHYIFGDDNFLN